MSDIEVERLGRLTQSLFEAPKSHSTSRRPRSLLYQPQLIRSWLQKHLSAGSRLVRLASQSPRTSAGAPPPSNCSNPNSMHDHKPKQPTEPQLQPPARSPPPHSSKSKLQKPLLLIQLPKPIPPPTSNPTTSPPSPPSSPTPPPPPSSSTCASPPNSNNPAVSRAPRTCP